MNAPAVLTVSAGRPKLREITFADFALISSFIADFGFTPTRTRAEWEHLWRNNPAYATTGTGFPLGWVLEDERQIVGHLANVPTLYRLGNRRLRCASGQDWAIVEKYRGYSQLMLDRYLQQDGIDLALSNGANVLSYRVHMELGASVVPLGRWDRTPAWITGYEALVDDWLTRKNIRLPRPLLCSVGTLLALKDTLSRMRVAIGSRRGMDVEISSSFDQRFDEFWDRLCARYPDKLLADRSLRTLQWHFHYAMVEDRLWIVTVSERGQLLGYAVFVHLPIRTPESSIHRVVLADFQSLEHDDRIFLTVLRSALELCRSRGVHLLITAGFSASGTDTSRLAPYPRPLPSPHFLYKTNDPQLAKSLACPQVWCPSLYDADYTL